MLLLKSLFSFTLFFMSWHVFGVTHKSIPSKSKKCSQNFERTEIKVKVELKDPRNGSSDSLTSQTSDNLVNLLKLPNYLDHTLLKPDAAQKDLQKLVDEALDFKFKAICVGACQVASVKKMLEENSSDKKPLIATVIGFPTGAHSTSAKVFEAIEAHKQGADELDMVINISYIKDRRLKEAEADIREVVQSVPIPIKVILETGLLTEKEIVIASQIVESAQAHFVKTSTGFSKGGATVKDIQLIKASISPDMKIKASGGIRDIEQALQLLSVGANRLGLSSSVPIMKSRADILSKAKDELSIMEK